MRDKRDIPSWALIALFVWSVCNGLCTVYGEASHVKFPPPPRLAEIGIKRKKLAEDYASCPKRIDRWGHRGFMAPLGGRRYVQSLDEAVAVIKLCKAYDLTRMSKVWSRAKKGGSRAGFFDQRQNHFCGSTRGEITIKRGITPG